MIRMVLRISWLNLKRDRLALILTFVLPILFFSIFAVVFGAMEREGLQRLNTAIVVEDDHPFSARLAEALGGDPLVRPVAWDRRGSPDRAAADSLVRTGAATLAIVLPSGLGDALQRESGTATIDVMVDSANPIAADYAVGLLRAASMQVGHELMSGQDGPGDQPLRFAVHDVNGDGGGSSTAFFAAGIGVLFLLFAVSGRSAILVEERESGVLRRMLGSRMRLWQLLVGRWLFLAALGAVQVTLMFVWGSIAFDLPLWAPRLLSGFVVMTVATAASAAGFGLLLGTVCRTRAQLNGVAAVVILVMSALGGSMFPTFLMPESLRRLGLVTFNSWALSGYQKVFWYDAGVLQLWPQVAVLLTLCALFMTAAHVAALRWRFAS